MVPSGTSAPTDLQEGPASPDRHAGNGQRHLLHQPGWLSMADVTTRSPTLANRLQLLRGINPIQRRHDPDQNDPIARASVASFKTRVLTFEAVKSSIMYKISIR